MLMNEPVIIIPAVENIFVYTVLRYKNTSKVVLAVYRVCFRGILL